MILIEELPGVYSEEKKLKLQRLMADCARSSPYPIVLVWSQVGSSTCSCRQQGALDLSRECDWFVDIREEYEEEVDASMLVMVIEGAFEETAS